MRVRVVPADEGAARVEVRHVGQIERVYSGKRGPRYVWVDGYAVVVDGAVRQPYLQKRAALHEAAAVREMLEKR
jgi:hypothetical protein